MIIAYTNVRRHLLLIRFKYQVIKSHVIGGISISNLITVFILIGSCRNKTFIVWYGDTRIELIIETHMRTRVCNAVLIFVGSIKFLIETVLLDMTLYYTEVAPNPF